MNILDSSMIPVSPIITSLLNEIDAHRQDSPWISSHWKIYGDRTVVRIENSRLILKSSGFGGISGAPMVNWIENKTYRKVTMKIKSFHPIHAAAKELMQELAFSPTFDTWKCAVILATLQDHWDTNRLSPKVFACIGD